MSYPQRMPAVCITFVCSLILLTCGQSIANAAELPGADSPYQFITRNQEINAALKTLGKNLGFVVNIDPAVKGTIHGQPKAQKTVRQFLNELSEEFGLNWFFDGQTLFVTPNSSVSSDIIALERNNVTVVIDALKRLGIYEDKFTHKIDARSRVLLVAGPPPYVKLIKQAVGALEKAEPAKIAVLRGTPNLPMALAPSGSLPLSSTVASPVEAGGE
ncbi:secretin N-terminal domain-containing protein [Brucella intermedia]|uniref:secretin N-terminal domain-containing protein n=1 Tax=Brucella intermedia TaxID=94625 RepID=UPI002362455A|nr:secretin N-terminal domain-containing protein [Brucella intermedia]